MSRVVREPATESRVRRCCELCGAPAQPVAALAEVVANVHKALDEAQGALEAQEQVIEDLRADADGRGIPGARTIATATSRPRMSLSFVVIGWAPFVREQFISGDSRIRRKLRRSWAGCPGTTSAHSRAG